MLTLRLALLLPIGLLSVGCSMLKSPTATVTGVSVGDLDADGITMKVDLDVANPNAVDLPVRGANYTLTLDGSKLVKGNVDNPGGTLPANGRARVTLPVAIAFDDLLSSVDAIGRASSGRGIDYALDAKVTFGAGPFTANATMPFSHSGTLSMDQFANDPLWLLKSGVFRKGLEGLLK